MQSKEVRKTRIVMKRWLWLILAIFSAAPFAAQGTLYWQWDNAAYYVQPTDQILLTGTISNASDTPFLIVGAGASFTGGSQAYYNFSYDFNFYGKTVPANGTLEFDFGILTPIGGHVPDGVYYSDSAFLNLSEDAITETGPIFPQNSFEIFVSVPEPSTIRLLGVVLGSVLAQRLRKGRIWIARA